MKEIKLSKEGYVALVDDEDYERLNKFTWCLAHGRATRGVHIGKKKTRTIFMHKELCPTSERLQVEHIDGDRLNNQKANLRAVLGGALRRQKKTKNKTGYKGVHKLHNRYVAKISHEGVIEYLGTFATALDAARAYDRKAIEYGIPEAYLNVRDIQSLEFLPETKQELSHVSDTDGQRIPAHIEPTHCGHGGEGHGQDDVQHVRERVCGE